MEQTTELDRSFGEAVRARVAEAVRRAEALSRGQLVPVVVEKSDAYPEVRYRGALLASGVAAAVVVALGLALPPAELVLVEVAAGLLGALASLWSPVERLLAGRRSRNEAARARAVRAFHEHGLHDTAEGTGVLVFASLFEREVVVLADRGIHDKVGDEAWSQAVAALTAGLRRGDPGQGFVDAIAACGARLAEHFPRDPSAATPPRNELEDAIRVERS
jgi:putative membrane protein